MKREIYIKNADRLSVNDLALYLGCKITECGDMAMPDRVFLLTPQVLRNIDHQPVSHNLKPILRPLNDIVEAEARGLLSLNDTERSIAGNVWYPNEYRWLLAHYFDVFGWIEAGRAIDANTLKSNPYKE